MIVVQEKILTQNNHKTKQIATVSNKKCVWFRPIRFETLPVSHFFSSFKEDCPLYFPIKVQIHLLN